MLRQGIDHPGVRRNAFLLALQMSRNNGIASYLWFSDRLPSSPRILDYRISASGSSP